MVGIEGGSSLHSALGVTNPAPGTFYEGFSQPEAYVPSEKQSGPIIGTKHAGCDNYVHPYYVRACVLMHNLFPFLTKNGEPAIWCMWMAIFLSMPNIRLG